MLLSFSSDLLSQGGKKKSLVEVWFTWVKCKSSKILLNSSDKVQLLKFTPSLPSDQYRELDDVQVLWNWCVGLESISWCCSRTCLDLSVITASEIPGKLGWEFVNGMKISVSFLYCTEIPDWSFGRKTISLWVWRYDNYMAQCDSLHSKMFMVFKGNIKLHSDMMCVSRFSYGAVSVFGSNFIVE